MEQGSDVCVIIAAKDAADTIARAIRSALSQSEASEVVVVDDGSSDATADVSRSADDGTGRLRVLTFETNKGPAAARNHAIASSRSPIISILDADDFFFPGRLKHLLAQKDWDLIADNIAFVDETSSAGVELVPDDFAPSPRQLTLAEFIQGNISRRGVRRGEIGFLKPLMRRAFLDRHGLRYRDALRLGEDYDLYARALSKGARYTIIHSCGYGAVVRGNSLSGSHRTLDLKRLYEADRAMLADGDLSPGARELIGEHERHIRGRYELREFLDVKRQSGSSAALAHAAGRPGAIPAILRGLWADKTERFRPIAPEAPIGLGGTGAIRYLLEQPVTDRQQ